MRGIFGSERVWLVLGLLLGFLWFQKNASLPPLFKGRVCCDSTDYILISKKFDSLAAWLDHDSLHPRGPESTERTIGYPTFLALHRKLLDAVGLDSWDSVQFSLYTTLLIYFATCLFFYRTLEQAGLKVHPVVLFLLLAHPGLVSHAALPLTDTQGTLLLMVASAAIVRAGWSFDRRSALLAALAGFSLGLAVLTRPSFQVPVAGGFALWGAAAAFRAWRASAKGLLALPALAALVFAFSISPQVYSCSAKFGKLCYQGPEINSAGAAQGLSMGMHGCRTYTMLFSKKHANSLITTYDQFYNQNFGDYCPIDPNRKIASIARCYADNFLVLPIFFGKKLVGLADNFHLNTYAAAITTKNQVAYNRVFGVLAFLGNLCCLALIARAVRRRQFGEPWFVPLGFYVSYLLLSIVFHVEGRFGFPMIPFALVALWLVLAHCTREGWSRHRGVASALLVALLLFFVQVELWDLRDPLPYETPEEINYQGESM